MIKWQLTSHNIKHALVPFGSPKTGLTYQSMVTTPKTQGMFVVDPLGPVCFEMGSLWI